MCLRVCVCLSLSLSLSLCVCVCVCVQVREGVRGGGEGVCGARGGPVDEFPNTGRLGRAIRV